MRWMAVLLAVMASVQVAAALDDVDRDAGRETISRQIDAFRRDDAATAFKYAAPGIRDRFAGEEAFLDMVRRAYPPVHRPRSFSFGEARDAAGGFEQSVAIQDEAGVDWDAVYTFERQPDGTWKISACRLVKRPGEAV